MPGWHGFERDASLNRSAVTPAHPARTGGIVQTMFLLPALFACSQRAPASAEAPASDPVLVMDPPIAGEAGVDWTVQNHVDVDPGPGARDSFGGHVTYDGHMGTDFRIHGLPAMVAGVEVLAPAAGRVLRSRDGKDDRCGSGERARVPSDQACGNGMVIDHGGGFETQLCHLRQGSLRVHDGDEVRAGQTVGLVGWSGMAEFPHVHITVRHDGTILDPFAPPIVGPAASWRSPAAVPPASHRVWATGFSGSLDLDTDQIMRAPAGVTALADDADAVVAYAFGLVNEHAPTWRLEARSPSGRLFQSEGALNGRATAFRSVGKRRRPGETLEHGTWTAHLEVGQVDAHQWEVEVVAGPVEPSVLPTWEGCAP